MDGQALASALAVDDVSVIRVDAEVMDHLFATRPHVVKIRFLVANRLQASSHAMFGEAEVDVEGRGGRAHEMDEVKKEEMQSILTSLKLFRGFGPEAYDALSISLGKIRFDVGAHLTVKGDVEPCGTSSPTVGPGCGYRVRTRATSHSLKWGQGTQLGRWGCS